MPYCKECGREVERDAKFCPHCGTRAPVKALKAPEEPKARPEVPQKVEKTVITIIAVVAIAVVIIVVLAAHFGGGGGLGGRGTPPSAMLTVTAEKSAGNTYKLTVEHEGGDDLVVADLQINASNSATTLATYDFPGTGTFSVGESAELTNCAYDENPEGKTITVYIIHVPSKQKIFSSSSVIVR